jgi:hypothetical protein
MTPGHAVPVGVFFLGSQKYLIACTQPRVF